jgi:hypothetical protein
MAWLREVVLFSLISWSLMLPPQIDGRRGDALADSSVMRPAVEWGSYDSKKECEQDRAKYSSDPVVGERMQAAKCMKFPSLPKPSAKDEL